MSKRQIDRESLNSRFGAAVRRFRHELELSQEELAERAGLHRTYVTDIERGARNLTLASIDKLARALGVSLARLFAAVEQPRPVAANPHSVVGAGAMEKRRAGRRPQAEPVASAVSK